MTQTRRDSPRIPYDEAICLARIDGEGRLYGRGLDLSASGISLVSTEACPVGTEIKCDILLPHGPRSVIGKIVRVTAAPGGFELAVAFGEIKPAVAAMIANLVAERPSTPGGVPRPALDVALDDQRSARTKRYGTPRPGDRERGAAPGDGARAANAGEAQATRLPPTSLPPPCGQPLPSVVVAASLARDQRAIESRPPPRRVHGTAYVARRPEMAAWALHSAAVMGTVNPGAGVMATERLTTLQMAAWWSRARWVALPVVAALALAIVTLHFSR